MTDDLITRLDAAIGGPDRRTKDGRRARKYTPLKVETQLLVDAKAEIERLERDLSVALEELDEEYRVAGKFMEEIERLREELKCRERECHVYFADSKRLTKELEETKQCLKQWMRGYYDRMIKEVQ
jgi:chromosome segregation ATPase